MEEKARKWRRKQGNGRQSYVMADTARKWQTQQGNGMKLGNGRHSKELFRISKTTRTSKNHPGLQRTSQDFKEPPTSSKNHSPKRDWSGRQLKNATQDKASTKNMVLSSPDLFCLAILFMVLFMVL
jgi:hypothetical protein